MTRPIDNGQTQRLRQATINKGRVERKQVDERDDTNETKQGGREGVKQGGQEEIQPPPGPIGENHRRVTVDLGLKKKGLLNWQLKKYSNNSINK